ncbi:S1-like domain-containing RNA-binding protein [Mangrovivirga sp. M17]|uniref:S1-like domain-containing RNA-binding protein n=2 Tax=Mangrovivirga halotolerans TaxID=2993936 RepID=A0ABT3RND6_9BACT|nr:S1-like domain-containing RNA-binding protein [Mangrovivirga halotolerans]MCX2742777.1 S1-like domain-containing RNA-binding protein [Mangrovivirga halotolerans]
MIEIGKYNKLRINRKTDHGLYLISESLEEVLLPNKYIPEDYSIDDYIDVFVYLDHEERKVATTLEPKIKLDEFGFLQVSDVTPVGAFMDWGLEKELMVPFKEQRQKMQPGRWYVVYMDFDVKTNRLFASNKIDKYLQNALLTINEGEEVDLLIYHISDMGYSAIINGQHRGLIYKDEVFRDLNVGDKTKGYIKKIREDKKVDLTLQPIGYENFNDKNAETIYNTLVNNGGFLPLSDKSKPEAIYDQFGISKKAFKKALGDLYKNRKITIDSDGITLNR